MDVGEKNQFKSDFTSFVKSKSCLHQSLDSKGVVAITAVSVIELLI